MPNYHGWYNRISSFKDYRCPFSFVCPLEFLVKLGTILILVLVIFNVLHTYFYYPVKNLRFDMARARARPRPPAHARTHAIEEEEDAAAAAFVSITIWGSVLSIASEL